MYRQDYDETNVYYSYGPGSTGTDDWINNAPTIGPSGKYSWGIAIMPYVKNTGVFRCPSLPPPMTRATGCASHAPMRWMSYGANLSNVGTQGGRWMNNIDSNVHNSNIITVSDGCGRFYNCPGKSSATCTSNTPGWAPPVNFDYEIPGNTGAQRQPHLDGGNYLYYDGHVKWQKNTKLRDYCPRI
jgi:prepilin-type processing-associated H-X9-DG protein